MILHVTTIHTSSQLCRLSKAFYHVLHSNKICTSRAFPHVETGLESLPSIHFHPKIPRLGLPPIFRHASSADPDKWPPPSRANPHDGSGTRRRECLVGGRTDPGHWFCHRHGASCTTLGSPSRAPGRPGHTRPDRWAHPSRYVGPEPEAGGVGGPENSRGSDCPGGGRPATSGVGHGARLGCQSLVLASSPTGTG